MHSGWANKAVQLTPFSLPRERAMPLWPNCSAKVRGSPLRCPVLSVWHTSEHHFPPWGVHYSNWHREQVAPTQWSQRGQGERDSTSLKQQLCSRGRLLRTHNHTHREDKTDTLTQTSMLYVPTISVQRKEGIVFISMFMQCRRSTLWSARERRAYEMRCHSVIRGREYLQALPFEEDACSSLSLLLRLLRLLQAAHSLWKTRSQRLGSW